VPPVRHGRLGTRWRGHAGTRRASVVRHRPTGRRLARPASRAAGRRVAKAGQLGCTRYGSLLRVGTAGARNRLRPMARPGGSRLTDVSRRVGGDVDRVARAGLGRLRGPADLLRPGWLGRPVAKAGWSGRAGDDVALMEAVGGAGRSRRLLVRSVGGWRAGMDGWVRRDRDQAA
jgi:hypothetical protein